MKTYLLFYLGSLYPRASTKALEVREEYFFLTNSELAQRHGLLDTAFDNVCKTCKQQHREFWKVNTSPLNKEQ